MKPCDHDHSSVHPHCCPCGSHNEDGVSRREFMTAGSLLGGLALTGLTWHSLASAEARAAAPAARQPLVVKPV
ncbi:MAG: twin-arginine translocation signal domain-containing protein, partial [Planctomycetota bacterium]|nr:twin-arginine translocation signal domain-containing protein [Planctomycetota bacterium]